MPFMEWTESMAVGVDQFDRDHKRLFGIINTLFDAIQAGKGREALGAVLEELIAYSKHHFAAEEHFMKKLNYEGLAEHVQEHDFLRRKIAEIQTLYNSGTSRALTMETFFFLKDWLDRHIQVTDRKYVPLFHANGIN